MALKTMVVVTCYPVGLGDPRSALREEIDAMSGLADPGKAVADILQKASDQGYPPTTPGFTVVITFEVW